MVLLFIIKAHELFPIDSAGIAQKVRCIRAHRLGFDNRLGIVIVVFHAEDINKLLLRRHIIHLRKYCIAFFVEIRLYLLGIHLRHVRITAVRKNFCRIFECLRIKHTYAFFCVQKLWLSCPQHS